MPLIRLRKLVTFDRLIARLIATAPDRWVLKGAVALHFRAGPRFRSTMDLDLGRYDDEQAATADLLLMQALDLEDYFQFAIQRTSRVDAPLEGAAVRYHVTAHINGRQFEAVIVDVGFGKPPLVEPDVLCGPDLLSFADIRPSEVPTVSLEQHVAEKLHAYTRVYAGRRASTRVKDLVDLAAISTLFPFEAGRLREALQHTFDDRSTHVLPDMLPPPPSHWSTAYRRMAAEMDLDPELTAGFRESRTFLDPLIGGYVPDDATWNPTRRAWR